MREAEQGVGLAERQLDRAATQRDTYQGWIDDGLNRWEMTPRSLPARAATAKYQRGGTRRGPDHGAGLRRGILGRLLRHRASARGSARRQWSDLCGDLRAWTPSLQITAETAAQINAATASFERRSQEWQLQRQLAEGEMAIGAQQVALAQTHTEVARSESSSPAPSSSTPRPPSSSWPHKFTNAELYAWMSGVLGGAYNYFLQQATAMAQLAQYQLAFERQESPPAFIKADYWEDTDEQARPAGRPEHAGPPGPDRLGAAAGRHHPAGPVRVRHQPAQAAAVPDLLAGPARTRRSSSCFRETGVLPFATPMALFDQGFPGHYLRMIKRVRVSVVALVPPARGLRATLIASGISRVVTGGDVFSTITVRRDPELIAFTGTSNATGQLELEPDGGMLLPFESMGVDTNWELQLPKAANPFDFGSIADVLFTVDYTALQDFSYRQQVIHQLDDRVSVERAISVRDQFPDQWYALHNPLPGEAPLSVQLTLTADGFPPHVDQLAIQQVLFAVVRARGPIFEIGPVGLRLTPAEGAVGGSAVEGSVGATVDGLISTRRGSGGAWIPFIGRSPAGTWQVTLPATEELRSRFRDEMIDDLLIILTYQGRTPPWPA